MARRESLGLGQATVVRGVRGVSIWRGWWLRLRKPAQVGPPRSAPADLAVGSPLLDACRTLRLNLSLGQPDTALSCLLMTGVSSSRDHALVAAGLALALAEAGRRTLLIDADLRRPSLHDVFSLPLAPGLANALDDVAVQPTPVMVSDNLSVLPAGHASRDPAELLCLPTTGSVLRHVADGYDSVVFCAAAQSRYPDVLVLAPYMGAAVFTVRAGTDSAEQVLRLKDILERANVPVLGFALLD